MPELHNCWYCGKSLLNIDMSDAEDVPFFHCDKICQSKCKTWNAKPKDHDGYDKSVSGIVEEVEDTNSRAPDSTHTCNHKYNCRKHREVCVEKYGYDPI